MRLPPSDLRAAYAARRGELERYVRRLGATPEEAEDVVATAFLRALESGRNLENAPAWAAWLRVVARNEWIDAQRRGRRLRALGERTSGTARQGARSAEQEAVDDERARAVLEAVARLPEAQRAAL